MKRNSLFKITVAAVLASQVSFAAAPINWGSTTLIKSLKPGVDLYESTDPNHPNRYFTERTLFYVGEEVGNPDLQKQVRSEICASDAIYRAPANAGFEAEFLPGSMGFYLHGNEVAAIADTGLAGKPLSRVLDDLKTLPDADKVVKAKYYVANMLFIMQRIHEADILWNEFDLSNFYVRPDGRLYAFDFSRAKKSAAAPAGVLEKDAEINKLISGPIFDLYNKLFPTPKRVALTELNNLLPAPFGTPTTSLAFTNAVVAALPNAAVGGFRAADNGLAGAFANAPAFLTNSVNIPFTPGIGYPSPLLRASHQTAPDKALFIHLDPLVAALIRVPTTGLPYVNEIKNNALIPLPDPDFCTGWTGNE